MIVQARSVASAKPVESSGAKPRPRTRTSDGNEYTGGSTGNGPAGVRRSPSRIMAEISVKTGFRYT